MTTPIATSVRKSREPGWFYRDDDDMRAAYAQLEDCTRQLQALTAPWHDSPESCGRTLIDLAVAKGLQVAPIDPHAVENLRQFCLSAEQWMSQVVVDQAPEVELDSFIAWVADDRRPQRDVSQPVVAAVRAFVAGWNGFDDVPYFAMVSVGLGMLIDRIQACPVVAMRSLDYVHHIDLVLQDAIAAGRRRVRAFN